MRLVKILERLLAAIPIMIGVAVIVFLFMRLTPGDPVDIMMGQGGMVTAGEIERLRSEFNLDKPLHEQLALFLFGLLRGDMGNSFTKQRPVAQLIAERLPATIELALGAMLFGLLVAFPIGIISAVRQNSLTDRLSMAGAFLGISMPPFWLGILLILIFSVHLKWLPVQGRIGADVHLTTVTGFYVLDSILTGNREALISSLRHLVLPSVTLGAAVAAIVARVLRSSMLECLRSDYVKLARAKGASEFSAVAKHALRNALIPTVTVVGLQVGVLLGGNMIVEAVFGWPGLGRLVVDAIFARDFPLVQGAVMVYAFTFVAANLIVDVLYTYLNPKIEM
ncbi:ABC transporter permease [Caldilinea sp.]|jgi:peptide/nickel transport system permease protein|uniref:ABC transporter permease n=1 Tax=Caldilinea sp. TaxID=2293560 RepID=UPI0021DEB579|nr:ABC transporter permease [Caldilinea sp.]GIV68821.1 MAG: peptide ABC transporter permease [Caldilinea sp.]